MFFVFFQVDKHNSQKDYKVTNFILIFFEILRDAIPVGTAMKLLMYINKFYPLVRIVF